MEHTAGGGSMIGPDFLGIGAPRCGTTWLFRVLFAHPDLWLSPVKELHYFDSIDPELKEGFHSDRRLYRLRRHGLGRLEHYLAFPLKNFIPSIRSRVNISPFWDLHYFFGDGSPRWYCEIFAPARKQGKRAGEITPAYSILCEQTIRLIHSLNPEMKIILLLRNPVERAWSGISMGFRGGGREQIDVNTLLDRLRTERNRRRTSYADNLERWMRVFGRERILVGFYDDIRDRPRNLIADICQFLEISDISGILPENAFRPVNASRFRAGEVPDEIATALAQMYEPQLRRLKGMLPGPPAHWHEQAVQRLGR